MKPHQIRQDQCEAARDIEEEFGANRAPAYLIGEKFITFVSAAEIEALIAVTTPFSAPATPSPPPTPPSDS